jgi:hypothetical protein
LHRAVAAFAALVILATASAPAAADAVTDAGTRPIVGILDIRVEGLPASAAGEFERQLEELSRDAGKGELWVASRARMEEILSGSSQWMGKGCLLGPCMQVVREQTHAELVMTVFLQGLGMTYRYVITVIRTDTGDVVDQRTEGCGACTQDEAISKATLAAIDALTAAPARLAAAGRDRHQLASREVAPLERRLGKARRRTRATALVLTGLAAIGGGLGGYWLSRDRDDLGRPALGAAGGLAAAGALCFAVSLTWD